MGNCGNKDDCKKIDKKTTRRLYEAEPMDTSMRDNNDDRLKTKIRIRRKSGSTNSRGKEYQLDNIEEEEEDGSVKFHMSGNKMTRRLSRPGRSPPQLRTSLRELGDTISPVRSSGFQSPSSPSLFGRQPVTPRKQLLLLAQQSDVAGVKQLLENGIKADEVTDNDGRSPIAHAAMCGDTRLVKLLVAYNVPVDQLSNDGWSPLHFAVMEHRFETARYFLEETSADVNQKSKHGFTPLALAVMKNNRSLIALLLSFGADKDAKDPYDKNAHERCA